MEEKLVSQLSGLSPEKLLELVDSGFQFARRPENPLRSVVLRFLEALPIIPDRILSELSDDQDLYEACGVRVKRQIWEKNVGLFGDEVRPLLERYVEEKEKLVWGVEEGFFTAAPRTRRQHEIVKELTKYVGGSLKLYNMLLQFIRTLFLSTKVVHYCTLRADVLMSLHDLEATIVLSADPCHEFGWCLDACIREKCVDPKHGQKLEKILDEIKTPNEQMRGDISMLLCDPFAVQAVTNTIINHLKQSVEKEILPRVNMEFCLLIRLLQFGLNAWDMISNQAFTEDDLSMIALTECLPMLGEILVEREIFNMNPQPSPDIHLLECCEGLSILMQTDQPAQAFVLEFIIQAAQEKDEFLLRAVLSPVAQACFKMPEVPSVFFHQFCHSLTLIPEPSAKLLGLVFDEFLLNFVSCEGVLRQMHQLLWLVSSKMDATTVTTMELLTHLTEACKPGEDHSEETKDFYTHLVEKTASLQKPRALMPAPSPPPEAAHSLLLDILPKSSPTNQMPMQMQIQMQ
eukprot:m.9160 g.9160  ORF g.9160 m.9160 type:complete len:516 (+) comp21130_c0_seq2:333-1880(+)